jgi:hypothetical protein
MLPPESESSHSNTLQHPSKRAQTGLSLRLRTLFGSILHADGGYADKVSFRCKREKQNSAALASA